MDYQPIIERSVASAIYDKTMTNGDIQIQSDVVSSAISSISAPYIEKQVPVQGDPMKKLVLQGAITSGSFYVYDYLMGRGTDSYMSYAKKGYATELLVYLYKMKGY